MLSIKHSCQFVWAGSLSLHPTPTPTHHHIISHKFQPPWLCVGRKCFLNRRGDRFLHANERSQATNYRAEETRSSGLGPRVGKKGAWLAITSKPRRGHAIFMAVWPGCYQRNSIFTLVGCALSLEWLKSLLLQELEEHFFWRDRRQFGNLNLGDFGEVW